MQIKDALKETGMAICPHESPYCYVRISAVDNSSVMWYDPKTNEVELAVSLEQLLRDDWVPFNPKKTPLPFKIKEDNFINELIDTIKVVYRLRNSTQGIQALDFRYIKTIIDRLPLEK